MAKIDLEKLICSLAKRKYFSEEKLQGALKEQGLEYKDCKIVQKPKFNVGDWVVWQNKCYKVNYNGCGYELIDQNDLSTSLEYGTVDESAHLWTIDDAKDGDVLVDVYGNIGIFEKHDDFEWTSYCSLGVRGGFQSFKVEHENGNACPATNAQRDTLFTKMKEAGYEWDADKKELKKIEAGKTSFANRQLYNRAILAILSNYVEKYPDTRFGQMLYNLGISSGAENNFYVESSKMYQNINATLKEQENGKNRVI